MSKIAEEKKKIIHFYCRPCGEYHLKTHPHYEEMRQRARDRQSKPKKRQSKSARPTTS